MGVTWATRFWWSHYTATPSPWHITHAICCSRWAGLPKWSFLRSAVSMCAASPSSACCCPWPNKFDFQLTSIGSLSAQFDKPCKIKPFALPFFFFFCLSFQQYMFHRKQMLQEATRLWNNHFWFLLLFRLLRCRSPGLLPDWLSSEVGLKAGFTSPGSSVIKAMAAAAESSGPRAATAKLEPWSGEQSWERLFRSLVRP